MFQPDLGEQQDIFILQKKKNNFHSSTQLGIEMIHYITLWYHKCGEEMKDS